MYVSFCRSGGAAEIRLHPFFTGIDWERLHTTTPPYTPRVEHELDTQNFEHFDEDMSMSAGSSRRKWEGKADPNFIGYTYKNWEAVQVMMAHTTRTCMHLHTHAHAGTHCVYDTCMRLLSLYQACVLSGVLILYLLLPPS